MGIYLLLNIVIVMRGVSGGIEKAGKVLMPLLFIILIIVSVKGLMLPGAMAGLEFLFMPDFSKVDSNVVLAALGQAFFSLSLGMGCMMTYGSYLKKQENLVQTTGMVTAMDTGVAILAGLVWSQQLALVLYSWLCLSCSLKWVVLLVSFWRSCSLSV